VYGLGSKTGPDGVTLLLTHTGSNGYWLADIPIMSRHGISILLAMNAGNDAANQAAEEIGRALRDRLRPFD
jgi:hypothetical protein